MTDLRQISNVELLDGAVAISYVRLPQDMRKNGLLWQHTVVVPIGSDYDDELEAFTDALQELLADVLDDETRAEPVEVEPIKEQEEDDEDAD